MKKIQKDELKQLQQSFIDAAIKDDALDCNVKTWKAADLFDMKLNNGIIEIDMGMDGVLRYVKKTIKGYQVGWIHTKYASYEDMEDCKLPKRVFKTIKGVANYLYKWTFY